MAKKKHSREKAEHEARLRSEAAQREIRVVGDPVLRGSARVVEVFDGTLRKTAFRLIGLMHDAPGVGLAAPQIGVQQRLIVCQVEEDDPQVLVNPEVRWRSDEEDELDEGCLSVPGVLVPITRSTAVEVRAQDLHGEELCVEAEGLRARVIQHEIDHLEGVLILDRTGRRERAAAMRELRGRVPAM